MQHLPRFPKAGKNATVDGNGQGLCVSASASASVSVATSAFRWPCKRCRSPRRSPSNMIYHTVFIKGLASITGIAECRTASLEFVFFFVAF